MKWADIVGYEGYYQISDTGIVKSVDRKIMSKDGTVYYKSGKIISQTISNAGYSMVGLWKNNKGKTKTVHRQMMLAFNPTDSYKYVNHIDGDKTNNTLSNLEWCSKADNANHAIANGLKVYTNRLTVEEFTECLYAVINGESYKDLSERVPYKVPFLSTKIRRLSKELDVEDLLNESLREQKSKRSQERWKS